MTRRWRKELPIERLREAFDYDPETGLLRWAIRKPPATIGEIAGCENGKGYIFVSLDYEIYFAHRVAWAIYYGTQPPEHIDHANGNGLNNWIKNLRECTQTTNNRNMRSRKKRNGLPKGVTRWSSRGCSYFRARIVINKRELSLGYFHTPEEAAAAYAKAVSEHFGEFARAT